MKTRKSAAVKRDRIRAIETRLRREYGQPDHHNPTDPLDDLVFVILSRMTQESKYTRTYADLRREFPTWEQVMDAPLDELIDLLRDAGLAGTKASHLQAIFKEVEAREDRLSLDRLRDLEEEEVERYLTSLPGVARKTAGCVMLYALGHDVCPVDAHVWRVMGRLGFAPCEPWSERGAKRLEDQIPRSLRRSLHVTLVAHGRAVCRARGPRCAACCLRDLCPSAGRGGADAPV